MKQILATPRDKIICMHDGFKNKKYVGCTVKILDEILLPLSVKQKCEFTQFEEDEEKK